MHSGNFGGHFRKFKSCSICADPLEAPLLTLCGLTRPTVSDHSDECVNVKEHFVFLVVVSSVLPRLAGSGLSRTAQKPTHRTQGIRNDTDLISYDQTHVQSGPNT